MMAIAFTGLLSLEWPGSATSQDKTPVDGAIRIQMQVVESGDFATITVFQEGKAIATKDVAINGGGAEFKKLSMGTYEVRFECPGWKTLVRQALVTETDKTAELTPKMVKGEGTLMIGTGPSLQELDDRIKKLEAAVAKLQGK
jgi:hypothetical protein